MIQNIQLNLPQQQQGSVLFVALVLLLILTILGLTSVQTSTSELKMARNTLDHKIAFEASDSALSNGANWIMQRTSAPDECSSAPCSDANKVYKKGVLDNLNFTNAGHSWWASTNTKELLTVGTKDIPEAATDPRFVVDVQFIRDDLNDDGPVPPGKHVFTVTGRGTGARNTAQGMVQQTVIKRF